MNMTGRLSGAMKEKRAEGRVKRPGASRDTKRQKGSVAQMAQVI